MKHVEKKICIYILSFRFFDDNEEEEEKNNLNAKKNTIS